MYEYGPMMDGNNWGWGVFTMVFWLIVLVIGTAVAVRLLRDHNHPQSDSQKVSPIDIVRERYAKGEITKEQFEELKKELK